jgi:hypothetical protein
VAAAMVATFMVAYSTTFTCLEGARMAVRSVYIGFAEAPLGISQQYPIIFARFSRIVDESSGVLSPLPPPQAF